MGSRSKKLSREVKNSLASFCTLGDPPSLAARLWSESETSVVSRTSHDLGYLYDFIRLLQHSSNADPALRGGEFGPNRFASPSARVSPM